MFGGGGGDGWVYKGFGDTAAVLVAVLRTAAWNTWRSQERKSFTFSVQALTAPDFSTQESMRRNFLPHIVASGRLGDGLLEAEGGGSGC